MQPHGLAVNFGMFIRSQVKCDIQIGVPIFFFFFFGDQRPGDISFQPKRSEARVVQLIVNHDHISQHFTHSTSMVGGSIMDLAFFFFFLHPSSQETTIASYLKKKKKTQRVPC